MENVRIFYGAAEFISAMDELPSPSVSRIEDTEGAIYAYRNRKGEFSYYVHGESVGFDYVKAQSMFYIKSLEDGATFQINKYFGVGAIFEWSTNGTNWYSTIIGNTYSIPNNGRVYVRNVGHGLNAIVGYYFFKFTKDVALGGNLMDLCKNDHDECFCNLFRDNPNIKSIPCFPKVTHEWCFQSMYYSCTGIESVPDIHMDFIPKGTFCNTFIFCSGIKHAPKLYTRKISENCFDGMFRGCTSLLDGMDILVKEAPNRCCFNMFYGCTSLVQAPILAPTTLKGECYMDMFHGCASLIESPVLPAKKLARDCYLAMFNNCLHLNSVTILATNGIGASGLDYWLDNVAEQGTLHVSRDANWDFEIYIPSGWTYVNDAD